MRFSRGGEPRIVTRDASSRCRKCARAFSLRNPQIINNLRVESQFVIPRQTWRNLDEEIWQLLPVTLRNTRFIGSMFLGLDDEIILQRSIRVFLSSFWKLKNESGWIRLNYSFWKWQMVIGWWKILIHCMTVSRRSLLQYCEN